MKKLKIKEKLNSSVYTKLFLTMSIVITIIILFLVLINNIVLERFYYNSKLEEVKKSYKKINELYTNEEYSEAKIEAEITTISSKNDFDVLIKTDKGIITYSTDKNLKNNLEKIYAASKEEGETTTTLYKTDTVEITKVKNTTESFNFVFLMGILDNGYTLYIRVPIAPIQESAKISNELLVGVAAVAIIIAGICTSFVTKKFTKPITELNEIATRMSELDFSKKYRINDSADEIDNLGKSINKMSDKLEKTIKQLQESNIELERDVEEKSKIEEMRTRFISDVSHELKTPIALIQGYAEGLIDNVNDDEESRKYYAEVILDESNKMDKLVKQLLELMKIEYGERAFNDTEFNITEMIEEVVRKCDMMIKEKEIKVKIKNKKPVIVNADEFYIEQVITNYLTNAIKHTKKVKDKKEIIINIEKNKKTGKNRISVENTGDKLNTEDFERVWKRFYKADESRNRSDGGTGIGLSIVKAIMTNYKSDYGVINTDTGVKFYFEI